MLGRGTGGRPRGSRPGGAIGNDGGPSPGRGWGAHLPSLLVTRPKVLPPQAPCQVVCLLIRSPSLAPGREAPSRGAALNCCLHGRPLASLMGRS